jgi:hypothetical protein
MDLQLTADLDKVDKLSVPSLKIVSLFMPHLNAQRGGGINRWTCRSSLIFWRTS